MARMTIKCNATVLESADRRKVDLSTGLDAALSTLFESQEPSEPPRKRRRVDGESLTGSDDAGVFATCFDVSIALAQDPRNGPAEHLAEGVHYPPPHADFGRPALQQPVRVILATGQDRLPNSVRRARQQKQEGSFPLDIRRPDQPKQQPVSLSLSGDESKRLVNTLDDVVRLCHRSPNKAGDLKAGDVAFAECYLVQPSEGSSTFSLRCQIKWRLGAQGIHFVQSRWLHEAAEKYLPGSAPPSRTHWTLQDFYENVFCPERNEEVSDALQAQDLASQLYPFQKRAVKWLLQREGVPSVTKLQRSRFFRAGTDALGVKLEVSHLLEEIRRDGEVIPETTLKGGILAEEMGLGKTVELITLMLLHQRPEICPEKDLDPYTGTVVRNSRATLVITPPHILGQWQSELAQHSPGLKVYHYQGLQKDRLTDTKTLRKLLFDQDVVLTTYPVLAREVHFARPPPERNLRFEKQHKARRSPLMEIYWWRVCLDEAQMVESGVSNAATVARLIPRVHAWAVSGTPLKKDIQDLLGLLIFLRYEPYCNAEVWKRLTRGYTDVLADLVHEIALRHPKSRLREELCLPPQKRVTITCSFTAIEAQRYQDLYRQMCEEVGVDESGAPATGDWDPENPATVAAMRAWLTRLRATCLHAEVGGRNRRALGTKAGPLRTVEEVLGVMIDQNETAMRTQERTVLNQMVVRGQLSSFGHQPQAALDIFRRALDVAKAAVSDSRTELADEKRKVEEQRKEEPEDAKCESSGDESEESDEDEAHNQRGRLGLCRQRLRSALEIQHVCYFFTATAYYQVKDKPELTEPGSDAWKELDKLESECYDEAKAIRKELLAAVTKNTNKLIDKVATAKQQSQEAFSPIRPFDNFRGLESRKIADRAESLRGMTNEYGMKLTEWRSKLIQLLRANLLDQEDVELTGEEYEETTKQQDEQYALLEALRAGHADRHCAVTGQINLLVNHEMKQALKLATDGKRDDVVDKGPAPELFRQILMDRQRLCPPENLQIATPHSITKPSVSIRGIMTEIRSMITSVQWQASDRSKAESAILERELDSLQAVSSAQTKEIEAFEKEMELLRSTMNQRLEFYRQLQQISDTVAPIQEEASDEIDQVRLARAQEVEDQASQRLATLMTKKRFLGHLQAQADNKADQNFCVICQDPFEIGVLTICGHQYCKDCIQIWWKQHRNCPTCKKHLSPLDFHQITYKPQELRAQEETSAAPSEDGSPGESSSSSPSRSSIYSSASNVTLTAIKSVDLPGDSYGVKIDMISRHLLWLRQSDPTTKSIIFSQYRDFLTVLGSAFRSHRIGFADISSKNGIEQFRNDPAKECFLLHAKADSSGLNLVNATHVFLCEPLVNAAIELQAIARVHRIGQRRATTVWMYLVADTVEEAIYDISVERRLAHMRRSTKSSTDVSRAVTPSPEVVEEEKLDKANSSLLQSGPISGLLTTGKSGGEMVEKGDLWNCLFGKGRRSGGVPFSLDGASDGPAAREMGAFLRAEAADDRRHAARR